MAIDSLDKFYIELVSAASEITRTLAVGTRPEIMFSDSKGISADIIQEKMKSSFTFTTRFSGVDDGRILVVIPETLTASLAASLMGTEVSPKVTSSEKSAVFELMNNITARWAVLFGDMVGSDLNINDQDLLEPSSEGAEISGDWVEIGVGVSLGQHESTLFCCLNEKLIEVLANKFSISSPQTEIAMDDEIRQDGEADEEGMLPPDNPSKEVLQKPGSADHTRRETPKAPKPKEQSYNIREAHFQQIRDEGREIDDNFVPHSIDLIMDVPLLISVELGRKDLTIKEILELSPGSLIELNQLAGEPVDLLINGKLFARGEVVVIDENFGIRVTAIISPQERLEKMRQ